MQTIDVSNNQQTLPKKIFWVFFCVFTLAIFIGLPILGGKEVLETAPSITPLLTLFMAIALPMVIAFDLFILLPLLIVNKKILVALIAAVSLFLTHRFVVSIVPIDYIIPQIATLVILYILFFLMCFSLAYSLGNKISGTMRGWHASYQSPRTFSDLSRNIPANVTANLKISALITIAGVVLLISFSIVCVLSMLSPSLWGLGLFEIKETFPSEALFQKSAQSEFFAKEISPRYNIQGFVRSPSVSTCWVNLPSEISHNYWLYKPVKNELLITDLDNSKLLCIATLDPTSYSLGTIMLKTEQLDDITIYRYSDTYFLVQYPGYKSFVQDSDRGVQIIKTAINSDSRRIWLLKGNTLLYAEIQNEGDKATLVSLLKSFRDTP